MIVTPHKLRLVVQIAAIAIIWALSGSAEAQDFQRYRPRTLAAPEYQPTVPAQPIKPTEGSDTVLVERLDAVLVLDEAAKVQPLEAFAELEGLHFDFDNKSALVYTSRFKQIVAGYLGGPITLRELNQMSRDIILFYRRSGLPVVDVIIPEQKITQGTVQIVVIEARIGEVRVEGGCSGRRSVVVDAPETSHTAIGKSIDAPHEVIVTSEQVVSESPRRNAADRCRVG